jgi:hypothetical protein
MHGGPGAPVRVSTPRDPETALTTSSASPAGSRADAPPNTPKASSRYQRGRTLNGACSTSRIWRMWRSMPTGSRRASTSSPASKAPVHAGWANDPVRHRAVVGRRHFQRCVLHPKASVGAARELLCAPTGPMTWS